MFIRVCERGEANERTKEVYGDDDDDEDERGGRGHVRNDAAPYTCAYVVRCSSYSTIIHPLSSPRFPSHQHVATHRIGARVRPGRIPDKSPVPEFNFRTSRARGDEVPRETISPPIPDRDNNTGLDEYDYHA